MVVISEKIHGTTFRAGYVPKNESLLPSLGSKQEFCYGSHRVQLSGRKGKNCWYGEDIYGKIAERYKLAEVIPEDYLLYGEIYGDGIQKNYNYGLKGDIAVVFFALKYKGQYVSWIDFQAFCIARLLPVVPVFYFGKYSPELKEKHTVGKSFLSPSQKVREGCVIVACPEVNDKRLGRKILKSINAEYLLKDNTDYK